MGSGWRGTKFRGEGRNTAVTSLTILLTSDVLPSCTSEHPLCSPEDSHIWHPGSLSSAHDGKISDYKDKGCSAFLKNMFNIINHWRNAISQQYTITSDPLQGSLSHTPSPQIINDSKDMDIKKLNFFTLQAKL